MNFDVSKSYTVKFALSEEEARDAFVDWVIIGDTTPVDVARYASITEIKKVYYPIRHFKVTYSGNWSATSIYEHEEEYLERVIVYVDHEGKEHKRPGSSTVYSNGSSRTINYRPMEKDVTRRRTVTDNITRTNGSVGQYESFQQIATHENDSDNAEAALAEWARRFSISGNGKTTDNQLSNCEILPLAKTDEDAEKAAEAIVCDILVDQCKSEVPGTRFTEFSLDQYYADSVMSIVLLPMYHISYFYEDKEYECYICGFDSNNVFSINKPVDEKLLNKIQNFENEMKTQKSSRFKVGCLSFVAIPLLYIFIAFMALFGQKSSIAEIILAIIAGSLELVFINMFFIKHENVKKDEKNHSTYIQNLDIERKRHAAAAKNQKSNYEDNSAETSPKSDTENLSVVAKNKFSQPRFIASAVVVVVIISSISSIIRDNKFNEQFQDKNTLSYSSNVYTGTPSSPSTNSQSQAQTQSPAQTQSTTSSTQVQMQTFLKAGMSISLPTNFAEVDVSANPNYLAGYNSVNCNIYIQKYSLSNFQDKNIANYTTVQYADALISTNNFSSNSEVVNGITYFVYQSNQGGNTLANVNAIFKSSTDFWIFTFTCNANDYPSLAKNIASWAETVKVN